MVASNPNHPCPPPPGFASIQLKEALALKAIADLNKAREGVGLPRVRLDLPRVRLDLAADPFAPREGDAAEFWADRLAPGQSEPAAAASSDRPPELQRDPREVASIIRSVLDSLEFINKAVAFAEAVDGYRFQEGSKISDTHFVRERVALLWCASVLIGETDVPPPNDFCSTYYSASSRVAS